MVPYINPVVGISDRLLGPDFSSLLWVFEGSALIRERHGRQPFRDSAGGFNDMFVNQLGEM